MPEDDIQNFEDGKDASLIEEFKTPVAPLSGVGDGDLGTASDAKVDPMGGGVGGSAAGTGRSEVQGQAATIFDPNDGRAPAAHQAVAVGPHDSPGYLHGGGQGKIRTSVKALLEDNQMPVEVLDHGDHLLFAANREAFPTPVTAFIGTVAYRGSTHTEEVFGGVGDGSGPTGLVPYLAEGFYVHVTPIYTDRRGDRLVFAAWSSSTTYSNVGDGVYYDRTSGGKTMRHYYTAIAASKGVTPTHGATWVEVAVGDVTDAAGNVWVRVGFGGLGSYSPGSHGYRCGDAIHVFKGGLVKSGWGDADKSWNCYFSAPTTNWFVAELAEEGPNGEANFTSGAYWVKEVSVNGDNWNGDTIKAASGFGFGHACDNYYGASAHPVRWVPAGNLGEIYGSDVQGTPVASFDGRHRLGDGGVPHGGMLDNGSTPKVIVFECLGNDAPAYVFYACAEIGLHQVECDPNAGVAGDYSTNCSWTYDIYWFGVGGRQLLASNLTPLTARLPGTQYTRTADCNTSGDFFGTAFFDIQANVWRLVRVWSEVPVTKTQTVVTSVNFGASTTTTKNLRVLEIQ